VCGFTAAAASGLIAYRVSGPYGERHRDGPRVQRFFDPATGRLSLLVYDGSGDGRFDTWAYMDGERVLRAEIDADGDGFIDRWEYYGSDGTVEKTGVASTHGGRPDIWRYPDRGALRTEPQPQP